ncbi:hypothetical protein K402DRAFT_428757 [Aulographum hederae CBS 113979]|uniref:Uncharacterized protein n=1 Tax=Aulographum hederae CBS 113979 TaxID=1176131 RepID=A0A6G1H3Y6_9PEZI|nr:hypothetical protein K402DRAFT_428757 [Aulographum hederae CBS 113979]
MSHLQHHPLRRPRHSPSNPRCHPPRHAPLLQIPRHHTSRAHHTPISHPHPGKTVTFPPIHTSFPISTPAPRLGAPCGAVRNRKSNGCDTP